MKVLFLVQKEQRAILDRLYDGIAEHCDCDLRWLSSDEQANLRRYFREQVDVTRYDRILFFLRFKKEMRQAAFIASVPNLVILEHDAYQNYIPCKYTGKFSAHYRRLPWARVISSGAVVARRLCEEGFDAVFVPKGYDQDLLHDLGRERDIELAFVGSTGSVAYSGRKALLEATIRMIAGAIDAQSPYTGGHCERVPELTFMLARAACAAQDGPYAGFALDADEWEALHIGAWLHDCGKVATPEHVVDKATKLETVYDRIHEVRMRFEVLKRDADIDYWRGIAEGGDAVALGERRDAAKAALDEEFAFVAAQTGMQNVVKLMDEIGVGKYPPYLSFSLGAGETTVQRMVNAYSILENGGKGRPPTLVDYVQDRRGNVIWPENWRPCDRCNAPDWNGKPMPRPAVKLKQIVEATPGQNVTVGDYTVRFDSLKVTQDDRKQMVTSEMTVFRNGAELTRMYPARWYFHGRESEPTSEVAIRRSFGEDLYVVMSDFNLAEQRASLEVHVNPLVNWLWLGFGVMALGTLIALLPETAFAFAAARVPEGAKTATASLLLLSIVLPAAVQAQDGTSGRVNKTALQRDIEGQVVCMCGSAGCVRATLENCPMRPACHGHTEQLAVLQQYMNEGKNREDILAAFVEKYGEQDVDEPERLHHDGLAAARQGEVGLVRDLQDLHVLTDLVDTTWTVLGVAAQGVRDQELLDVVDACSAETARQTKWLDTRLKQAAPQALVVDPG